MIMNRGYIYTIAAISGLVLFGAGCFEKQAQDTANDGKATSPSQAEEKSGVFQSIKDAFDKSIAIKCEYADEDGDVVTTYIKNKKIYLESQPETDEDGTLYPLIRGITMDDKMYIWTAESKQGVMLDLQDATEPAKMGDTEVRSTADIIKKLEEKKENCKPETIADSTFDLPEGVEFKSFSDAWNNE